MRMKDCWMLRLAITDTRMERIGEEVEEDKIVVAACSVALEDSDLMGVELATLLLLVVPDVVDEEGVAGEVVEELADVAEEVTIAGGVDSLQATGGVVVTIKVIGGNLLVSEGFSYSHSYDQCLMG